MAGLTFAAYDLAHALELLRHSLVRGDDVVEGVGDFPEEPLVLDTHSYREVAGPHGAQR